MKEPLLEEPDPGGAALDAVSIAENREFDLQGRSLRQHAARGTIVNTAFTVGVNTLNLLRGFAVAAFLTAEDYGVWGIVVVALGTLSWLKQVGFSEKYVQQEEADQEAAFQKAFTLELIANGLLMVALVAVIPLAVVVYGQHRIIAPALAVVAVIPAYALQTPVWVFYRRMDFLRQRTLQAIDPVLGFVVAVGLAIAGAGYWAFVASMFVGAWANAIVIWRAAPYPLRLRWDRGTTRDYLSFSWPLFVSGASALVMAQGTVIVASQRLGLAAVGAMSLGNTISGYAHRVDEVITTTLYPAICAVQERLDLLAEAFVKSNRLTLMWGMPFGAGAALFVADLVHFGIGDHWAFAIRLLQAGAVVGAINHIGFNWSAFFRARGVTRPVAVSTVINLVTFAVGPVPFLILWKLDGYAAGLVLAAVVQLAVRGWFLSRLFRGFDIVRHSLRAVAPTVPAVGAVLALRAAEPFHRTLGVAVGELFVYGLVTLAATWFFERALLTEAVGYLRGRKGASIVPAAPSPAG
jgi:O-antigen/teichoic acid export membrane protein